MIIVLYQLERSCPTPPNVDHFPLLLQDPFLHERDFPS